MKHENMRRIRRNKIRRGRDKQLAMGIAKSFVVILLIVFGSICSTLILMNLG